ncbi:MAG: AAA-like domain-containing protein [Acidobacteriota bacterium]|nr:AAA-like domain-containing protein [Acidobacteriota bacterium]
MSRFFNTSGPCQPEKHYMIPGAERFDLDHVRGLIDKERYFILHAPRQTGKTTLMRHLARTILAEGRYVALYVNIEAAQPARNNLELVNTIILSEIKRAALLYLPEKYRPKPEHDAVAPANGLSEFLTHWCLALPLPLVLFLDEVDALIGDGLLSVLRQLRAGYNDRPKGYPQSICLMGLRDVRDYRIFSEKDQKYIIGGSAFNIKEKSLVMDNFSHEQVNALLQQHTQETGQSFAPDAIDLIYQKTHGQPWLVNALARELCFEATSPAQGGAVTAAHVREAAEGLIRRRDVHLDQLSDKLTEPRVARVIQAILLSESGPAVDALSNEDRQYVVDLGLVRRGKDGLEIANPIYREVIPRELTRVDEDFMGQDPLWYRTDEGRLDMEKMLGEMVLYYRRHHDLITKRKTYNEAAHHLVFMTWLHRIVNSGGYIEREYAVGLGRMDLHITYADQQFAIELKLLKGNAKEEGMEQLAAYLDRLGLAQGYLVLFQRGVIEDLDAVGRREQTCLRGKRIDILYL